MSRQRINSNRTVSFGSKLSGVCFFLLACIIAQGQGGGVDTAGTGGLHSIQGRILAPSGQRADLRFKIRLESSGFGDLSVLSDMNGNFSFQNLRAGNYTVVVEGGDFYETVTESVFIEPASMTGRRVGGGSFSIARPFTVQIYLRPKQQPANAKPGVLDASLANVPAAAVECYNRGLELVRQGESDKAIEQLKQAVALYPGFALAYNQLGVQYLKRRQVDKAADALAMAVKLSPDEYEPYLNYGVALLNQMKFTEAEQHLRDALKKNETAFAPHLYLGMALVSLKNYQEAETELQKAVTLGGDKAAQAHYFLGGLYWRARDYPRAVSELERFLRLEPNAPNAEQIRATIKDLRNKS